MQITRASSSLTRPFTPPNNKSKVSQLPPAPHQRSGFDSKQEEKVLNGLELLGMRIDNGNPLLWPQLYLLKAKVEFFLHFINKDEIFHNEYKKSFNFDQRKNPFKVYLDELKKKDWYMNNGGIFAGDSLIDSWVNYIKEINARNNKSEFITKWTTNLEKIQALIEYDQKKFEREYKPER